MAVIGVVLAAVAARLTYVQVIASGRYAEVGNSQLLHPVALPAGRGTIVDDKGNVLAMSIPETTIIADPHQVVDPYRDAVALAPLLGQPVASLQAELSRDSGFVYLARQVDRSVAAKVKALHLVGITFESEPKRFYPDGTMAAPVVGQVGIDGQGLSGLELQYNSQLAGRAGSEVIERDPAGNVIPGGVRSLKKPVAGRGLVLTLNQPLQYAAETALEQQVVRTKAKGGVAIVMDRRTGDILAMANVTAGANGAPPAPSSYNAATDRVYEPGSVIKAVVLSGALENGVVTPSTHFTVPDQISLYNTTFSDAETHPPESLSVSDIIAQSSNVGTYYIAKQLGADQLEHYEREFGLGQLTGVGFPGESPGILLPLSSWSGTSLADEAIGQEEAVTPLQLIDAYNTIANGGVMLQPRLVEGTLGPNGTRHAVAPAPGRRVVPASVAQEVTSVLEGVVQSPQGTGTAAAIAGYTVAGKTGTAQEPQPGVPASASKAFMASFAGFVPAQQPVFTTLVVLDQPDSEYGGMAAAPVFAQISQYALAEFGVPPVGTQQSQPGVQAAPPPAGSSSPPVDTSKLHVKD